LLLPRELPRSLLPSLSPLHDVSLDNAASEHTWDGQAAVPEDSDGVQDDLSFSKARNVDAGIRWSPSDHSLASSDGYHSERSRNSIGLSTVYAINDILLVLNDVTVLVESPADIFWSQTTHIMNVSNMTIS
jgi:hypothetical protein